jgi:hypothetical protein
MGKAMRHWLKTWPEYFEAVFNGSKPFEVRRDDRGFAVGDTLVLQEYHPSNGYTGRLVGREITYILPGGDFGIEPGFVVLGLKKMGLSHIQAGSESQNAKRESKDTARIFDAGIKTPYGLQWGREIAFFRVCERVFHDNDTASAR